MKHCSTVANFAQCSGYAILSQSARKRRRGRRWRFFDVRVHVGNGSKREKLMMSCKQRACCVFAGMQYQYGGVEPGEHGACFGRDASGRRHGTHACAASKAHRFQISHRRTRVTRDEAPTLPLIRGCQKYNITESRHQNRAPQQAARARPKLRARLPRYRFLAEYVQHRCLECICCKHEQCKRSFEQLKYQLRFSGRAVLPPALCFVLRPTKRGSVASLLLACISLRLPLPVQQHQHLLPPAPKSPARRP